MAPLVSVLFPTTGRPERARRCLENLHETTEGHALEVIAAVDADPETRREIGGLADRLLYSPIYRGAAKAWNDCLAEAKGELIVWAADDLVFGVGWLDAALRTEAENPDCLIGLNDGTTPPDRATHFLMSRRFIIEVLGGVVAWPEYIHSFHDLEICERAKREDRYVFCAEAHAHHEHWLWGSREADDTDARNLSHHAESQRLYHQRAAAGFPNDYEPVIR